MALLFIWNDSYKTGISTIDTQHKKLVDLINELHDAMTKGQGNQVIGKIVNELVNYTITHFAAEERLMKQAGYADFDAHKKIHDDFTAKVRDMQKSLADGQKMMSLQVSTFLKEWLSGHIMGTDKKYVPTLSAKGIA
jgi:hemerythrin